MPEQTPAERMIELLEQILEEMRGINEQKHPAPQAVSQSSSGYKQYTKSENTGFISDKQLPWLQKLLGIKRLNEKDILTKYNIAQLSDMRFEDARKLIGELDDRPRK